MQRETVRNAYTSCRARCGAAIAEKSLRDFGGDDYDLDNVPQAKWPALKAALENAKPARAFAAETKPTSIGDIDTASIYARWNSAKGRGDA